MKSKVNQIKQNPGIKFNIIIGKTEKRKIALNKKQ